MENTRTPVEGFSWRPFLRFRVIIPAFGGDPRAAANYKLIPRNRRHNPLDHPVQRRLARLMPVPNQHNVMLRIDPDNIPAIAHGSETRRRPARPLLLLRIQPP